MSDLTSQKCKACEGGVDPLSEDQVMELLPQVPGWQSDPSFTTIVRTFECTDFQRSIVLINQIANIAEEEGHHPDIFLHKYKHVTVSLTTNAIDGLSENDFIVAAKINGVAMPSGIIGFR